MWKHKINIARIIMSVVVIGFVTILTTVCYSEKPAAPKPYSAGTNSVKIEDLNYNLPYAAAKGDLKEVKRLLSRGADINAKSKDVGMTALTFAAERNHFEIVEFLLNNGADINIKGQNGRTALMHALVRGRNLKVIKILLDRGSDLTARNDHGETVFMVACQGRMLDGSHLEVMKMLLDGGSDINAKNNEGNTALDLLPCCPPEARAVEFLKSRGALGKNKQYIH